MQIHDTTHLFIECFKVWQKLVAALQISINAPAYTELLLQGKFDAIHFKKGISEI